MTIQYVLEKERGRRTGHILVPGAAVASAYDAHSHINSADYTVQAPKAHRNGGCDFQQCIHNSR